MRDRRFRRWDGSMEGLRASLATPTLRQIVDRRRSLVTQKKRLQASVARWQRRLDECLRELEHLRIAEAALRVAEGGQREVVVAVKPRERGEKLCDRVERVVLAQRMPFRVPTICDEVYRHFGETPTQSHVLAYVRRWMADGWVKRLERGLYQVLRRPDGTVGPPR